jgi:Tfp pilus assembly protein PilV
LLAPSFNSQKGEALIEALVSIVLLSVMMIAQTYLVAKTAVSQKNSSMLNMALFQLRQQAQTQGISNLCNAAAPIVVAGNSVEITATCQTNAVTATFPGGTVTTAPVITGSTLQTKATAANKALLGGDGVISLN